MNSPLIGNEARYLDLFIRLQDKNGLIVIGSKTISAELKVSLGEARNLTARLKKKGYLQTVKIKNGRGGYGFYKLNASLSPLKNEIFIIEEQSADKFLKIGWTRDMMEELKNIKDSSPYPIKVIKIIKADENVYNKLTTQIKKWNIKGNWYHRLPGLAHILKSL